MSQSPFLFMKENSQTVLWNDSADPKELKEALTWESSVRPVTQ